MKRKKRQFEIFNLSFLDVISCGFGAVVLLVLISNYSEFTASADEDESLKLLNNVLDAEQVADDLRGQLEKSISALQSKETLLAAFQDSVDMLQKNLSMTASQNKTMQEQREGLELVKTSLKRASIRPRTAQKRDDEVGGIPVDSDYVIFIMDTSGSMKDIWDRVTQEFVNVMNIHPKIKGFQIINDNGTHLISAYQGRWIPDTPKRRQSVIDLFKGWNSASNSSPVEGLEAALRQYAKPGRSLSIYIFGDDYSGASYDPVINMLVKLNTNRVTGKRLAKVHGVGFVSGYTTNRFSILMREVARRNEGTFIALPR
ncbi:MAG: hypothetical protein JKY27_01205 [Magnetovibrio sp.]|nr:hypothetical protein [Magnetovibrio sp.]